MNGHGYGVGWAQVNFSDSKGGRTQSLLTYRLYGSESEKIIAICEPWVILGQQYLNNRFVDQFGSNTVDQTAMKSTMLYRLGAKRPRQTNNWS